MSKSASKHAKHVSEHVIKSNGPKKQSPNGQGERPRDSFNWYAELLSIEPMDNHEDTMKYFEDFVAREIQPHTATIHSISEVKDQNDGGPSRPWVDISVTVYSACVGNQRGDLNKELRVMCGLKRLRSQDGEPEKLHIRQQQREILWKRH